MDTPRLLLEHYLKQLRLPTMMREFPKLGEQCAKEGVTFEQFLLRLVEQEMTDRERRATERRIHAARFPVSKSLETYDFLSIPSLNKKLVVELAGRQSGNSRNGVSSKTVRGDFGEVEIETPRDRNASFEPKVVAKRQSSVGNFSEIVLSLYTRGLSTREIEEHVKEIYGIDISPQFVSRVTDELQQQIVEWQNRPLDRVYPIVFVDGLRVSVRTEKGVLKKCVYTVLGVDVEGRQEVLGLWIEDTEGARFWLKVLNDLKARGVEDVLIVCLDGLTGLPHAVECAYPQADVQLCVVHHIRNVTKFVSWKDRKALCADMRPIYTAPTIEAAEQALQQFEGNWAQRYPTSVAAWRSHWPYLTTFFKYPVELRRIIYTTNAIESLHSQMRKNIASRKMFPHNESVIKILFLNIRNFSNRWTRHQGWDIVMSQLLVLFGDRLKSHLIDSL